MPKPHFPTAVITVSKDEITLPENSIDVNASLSTDPDKHGVISKWEWSGVGVVFSTPNAISSKATFSGVGKPTINLVVYDHAGHKSDMVSKTVTVKPAPLPPQVTLGADVIIEAPEDKVTISASIVDPLPITSMRWNIINGSGEIISPTAQTTDVINLSVGLSTLKFSATNNAGLSSEEEMTILVKPAPLPPIEFGAKLQGSVDDQITAFSSLGAKWTRSGHILQSYNGEADRGLDQYFAAGIKVAYNLTWSTAKPAPFCKDLVLYESKLRLFLNRYAAQFKATGSFVMNENEPLNIGYYGLAPIEDYITLCTIFVRVCHEFGVKCADGCSFVEYLNMIRLNSWATRLNLKIENQKKLIEAFKIIPYDYLNVHYVIKNNFIPVDDIKLALDYFRSQTGRQVVTNEYHYEGCSAGTGIVSTTTNEWRKGGVLICVTWSGDVVDGIMIPGENSDADAFSLNANLTKMGIELRDATK